MRALLPRRSPKAARALAGLAVALSAVGSSVGCGLALSGLAPLPGAGLADASQDDASLPGSGDASRPDGPADGGSVPGALDAALDASPLDPDALPFLDAAAADAAPACIPSDAGLNGVLDLAAFTLAGSAVYDENSDGRITLTNSQNNESGAAWYPTKMPDVSGYDLTWSLRVGPGNIAGDGITFAVLASSGVPDVGDTGDGLGLRNITAPGGAVPAGYAVDVDMFRNTSDPTDLGPTTLKLVAMPGFRIVAETAVPSALNDGNLYAVDVSWRAPSTLTATLHAPGGALVKVSSSDPGLTAAGGYLGFTAATGGSDSHNEIAGITVADTCGR